MTGSLGFLGQYVVRELTEQGFDVLGYDIKNGPDYDITRCDLEILKTVDVVVHLAAYVGLVKAARNPPESAFTTCYGTERLLDGCVRFGVKRFILASTWAVNGLGINPYDYGKRYCESAVKSAYKLRGLDYTILRFGTAYGPGMRDEGVIQNFIKKAKAGEKLVIHGRGEQNRQFTSAFDIARGDRDWETYNPSL